MVRLGSVTEVEIGGAPLDNGCFARRTAVGACLEFPLGAFL